MSGIVNLMQTESATAVMEQLGYPAYVLTILGVAKILGAIALVQTKWKTIKEWAYAGFTFDILGAFFSTAFVNGIRPALGTLIFLAVMIISYSTGKKLERKK